MPGTLSVIVPVYNVVAYLDECLASLASQTFRDTEVIVVDDGSTDGSQEVATRFCAGDPRFRLITKPNAGLGAARNTGLEAATGEYLMFVDSDDVVPAYAAEVLISALTHGGGDFASGNVMRLMGQRLTPSPLHRRPFQQTRLGTHIRRDMSLINDRTAWNKVFRRRFWDAHELRFPEGVLYEDTPVTIPAHVLAESVHALDIPVYYWRERETGGERSITQRREELKGFVDRFTAVDGVSRFLAARGESALKIEYDRSVLRSDLRLFLDVLPEVDDEYLQVFLDRCNHFLAQTPPDSFDGLHQSLAIQWHLVRERKMPELLNVIRAVRAGGRNKLVRRGWRRYHKLPYLDDNLPGLPRRMYRAGTPAPKTAVHELEIDGGRLRVRGHGLIPKTPAASPLSAVRVLAFIQADGGRRIISLTRPRRCPDATRHASATSRSYAGAGFETTIDLTALREPDGSWRPSVWRSSLMLAHPTQRSRGPLYLHDYAQALSPPATWVTPQTRVTATFGHAGLEFRVEQIGARATSCRMEDDALVVDGDLLAIGQPTELRLSRTPGVVANTFPVKAQDGRFFARIPLSALRDGVAATRPERILGQHGDRWLVTIAEAGPTAEALPVAADAAAALHHRVGGHDLYAQSLPTGDLSVAMVPTGPVLTSAEWDPDRGLLLRGDLSDPADPEPGDFTVTLRCRRPDTTVTFPTTSDGGHWTAVIDPIAVPAVGGTVHLRTGGWDVLRRFRTGGVEVTDQLPVTPAVADVLPLSTTRGTRPLRLLRVDTERIMLAVGSDLADDERGKYATAQLAARAYPRMRRAPLREAVLFNSFTGRQFSDSPRAIHEELVARGFAAPLRWVVNDGQVALPETAAPIRLHSREWFEAYATSRYIVSNQHLPAWFRRRPGQVVMQTWHGTPLKRIGHDIESVHFADRRYLEKLPTEVAQWSVLLSPNRFSTPILRQAFRYEGEILESGYPRNDVLFRGRDETAARVRRRLGIPDGKQVVLYAPTWRDDESAGGRYQLSLHLDVLAAASALGDSQVLLLRAHPNVAGQPMPTAPGYFWNVSTYPDMADLLAAADVLITDYSSVMFDYASTGRPMLFFTYDLAHYRDHLRGFYFDFEAEAPGPLLATSAEVIEALRDVSATSGPYQTAYQAFANRAGGLDDGYAAARATDRLLAGDR